MGNLPQIPKFHSWLKFKTWADEYGPIYRLNIAGVEHVVVSSEKIANDLMRERGNLYSDRPQLPMAAKLLSADLRPLFLPYGETWRAFRKFTHTVAMPAAAAEYEPLQEEEALRVIHDLIEDHSKYETYFERYAASVIMRLNYGITLFTGKEEVAQRILMVDHHLERIASPGAYLVDTFPSLMHLPDWLAPFKREGKRLHAEEYDLFSSQVKDVEKRFRAGDPSVENTFTKRWLETKTKYNMSDDHAYYVLGTIFEAAAGTTSAAMMSFILAMVLHPEKFDKLTKEIDSVVGNDRLPTFEDMPRLPYVRACAKETLRWRPVTAGGLPHQITTRDDIYNGYLIRKDSIIHGVQWAIHRDPDLYPEAESFLPERWLDPKYPTYREPLSQYPNLTNFSSFGFGRRICPGHHIAERSLNIEVAMIAWACEIRVKKGKKPPEYDYTTGFNAQPRWFDFELSTRSGRDELVNEKFERVWGRRIRENVGLA